MHIYRLLCCGLIIVAMVGWQSALSRRHFVDSARTERMVVIAVPVLPVSLQKQVAEETPVAGAMVGQTTIVVCS